MNIEELLNKYFEGETTAQEEAFLRRQSRKQDAHPSLAECKPLFDWVDKERKENKTESKIQPKKYPIPIRASIRIRTIAAAACLALAITLSSVLIYINVSTDPCLCATGYVVIDGQCYADPDKAREMAMQVLQDMSTPDNEIFPPKGFFINNK